MTFSKKVETQGSGSSATSEDWNKYNEALWNAFDVEPVTDAKGKLIKESDEIGVLNFIMELGNQPQPPASMKSNLPVPAEGEDNSPEELERLEKFPNNWFAWEQDWDNTKKEMVRVRKVFWNVNPEESLILAVDFPSIKVDYSLHPMSSSDEPEVKPLRVDYNGKFKQSFERTVTNTVNWKTGKFGDKDIKYSITKACGTLADYQNDSHDISYLVQATCNWKLVMDKNVTDKGTYYNIKIKAPSAIQDIKTRKEVYTVAEQLEDNKCDIPFTGIFFDTDDDSHYSQEQLQQVRGFWWEQAKKAVQIDKNEGSNREGTWLEGINWEDSSLCRAAKKFGFDVAGSPSTSNTASESTSQPNPAPKKVETKVSTPEPQEPSDVDFDDD